MTALPLLCHAQITLTNVAHIMDQGAFNGVRVWSNYLYAATSDGLYVYDISDPTHPHKTAHVNDGCAISLAISGQHVFVASTYAGLCIYDISSPTNPVLVTCAGAAYGGSTVDVALLGQYAYVANGSDGLRVFDVSNVTNPVSVAHIPEGGMASGIAILGDFAFLANYQDGLRTYNVHNPTNPISIGHTTNDFYHYANAVAVTDGFAYVADDIFYDLFICDVSNPTNPVTAAIVQVPGIGFGVALSGNYAFLGDSNAGLRIYDISRPRSPSQVVQSLANAEAHGVAVAGDYAYVADYDNGIIVYSLGPQSRQALAIRLTATNTALISWPTPTLAQTLQQTTSLNPPNWTVVTNAPSVVSGRNQVTVPILATRQFFRLQFP